MNNSTNEERCKRWRKEELKQGDSAVFDLISIQGTFLFPRRLPQISRPKIRGYCRSDGLRGSPCGWYWKYPCFGDGAVDRVECQDAIVVVLDPLRWEDGGWERINVTERWMN